MTQQDPPWLLATISAYTSQRRRNIIRATWQTLYADPAFDTRFVIAQPSPLWLPLIKHENDTYGDLIVLDQLNESAAVANTIKSIEFFKHLVARSAAQTPWKFVSKIDDDSFLSARRFYTDFLLPRLHPHPAATADDDDDDDASTGTLIARRLRTRADRNFSAPGGQFYTLSWDLVRLVAATHTQNPITHLPEDVLIGRLLSDAHARFEFVELDDRQAFDVDEQMQRVGMEKEVLGEMDEAAVNPHKMKDDESYLRVAGLFGRDGFVGEEVGSSAEFGDGKGDVGIDG
ncbi:hypothetical protein IMSHALPRED_001041 [Imshaugia aleurites]|uniref:Hexosyltransferase n=1 Tax=Imshaugia aleurites TaxID=172621 RepID=A0A8H3PE49_9LECA|nr:hypothetical protein IMSHALPRED_001041 [Imshaugia aleurites]